MRIFKVNVFNKWAAKEGLGNDVLQSAVAEMERGLIDADLGGYMVKKRVPIGARGKSGGLRTLLAYRLSDKAFFVYGYAKSVRANINADELKALKHLAKELLRYNDSMLNQAIEHGALIKVVNDG